MTELAHVLLADMRTKAPSILFQLKTGERWRLVPLPGIADLELAALLLWVNMLSVCPQDVDDAWETMNPELKRHFQPFND